MAAPIPPAIVCESSPVKHHAYWPVADMPLGDFKRAQQSLAAIYGGDPAVFDLPRIMRLHGYRPAQGEPCADQLLHCGPDNPAILPELAAAFRLPHRLRRAATARGCDTGQPTQGHKE